MRSARQRLQSRRIQLVRRAAEDIVHLRLIKQAKEIEVGVHERGARLLLEGEEVDIRDLRSAGRGFEGRSRSHGLGDSDFSCRGRGGALGVRYDGRLLGRTGSLAAGGHDTAGWAGGGTNGTAARGDAAKAVDVLGGDARDEEGEKGRNRELNEMNIRWFGLYTKEYVL